MSEKHTPNIFKFATKELSQDAYFKYLLDCFNSHDENEKQMSIDFIKEMLCYKEKVTDVFVYEGQYEHIDCLC